MKRIFLLLVLVNMTIAYSQKRQLWNETVTSKPALINTEKLQIQNPNIFTLDVEGLKASLTNVPKRGSNRLNSNIVLTFPNSEGKLENFRIIEASVFSPELQARYPEIRSYAGQGIEDPSAVLRFSISPLGFQGMIISANKPATFIEVFSDDLSQYVVFKRKDKLNYNDAFECSVVESANRLLNDSNNGFRNNADDSILRTYRLAVSATGEYTNYHGGTKPLALAAINNTMTRVNGIFEVDFNVTMVLIANTDDVIYTNTATDPYGNTTGSYNSELQSTLTSVIGEANYDIGHLFANLQNNGNAGCIGCVCVNNQKGSGWTSAAVPEGDFFDVDYVAHEMGHQFGANHTWTFGGNEGTNVQVEPGSGSTIMSYAGITGATDVQANVHPNFHAVSIEQVTDYIKSTSCQTNTNTGNAVPVVNAGSDYTIPRATPFVLEGTATDADAGDVLSYSWEQMDENNASTTYPSTTATTGVAFRAYEPVTDNKRYFPRLETVKTGATSWQWEAVPNVSRALNFRLTVRDNVAGGGANESDDMVVNVTTAAGPFVVTAPNTNVAWDAGTTQTVTWNVAGTTGNGINAANVDIFLSTDGGDTYPITLATGVANDGSHDIVVPNNPGTQNRIMVRGSNHIFFDISNANFTINLSTPTFSMAVSPDSNESCTPATADYTIDLTSFLGFNTPVTLSTTGLPSGASESFSLNPVTPTGSSILTLDPGTAAFGTYMITITGDGGGITRTFDISYTISPGVLSTTTLIAPANGQLAVSTSPTLSWNAVANSDSYELVVATDSGLSNVVSSQTGLTNTSVSLSGLSYDTDYYWRVRAINNCANGNWSPIWQFTTDQAPQCTGTIINTYPYLETFDAGIGDWTQATGDDGNWTLDANGTQSGNTGPSDDITGGGNYFYTEASNGGGNLGPNATAILNSPCYDLSGLTEAYFSFYYHMYGSNMGTLDLEISVDDGSNWTNIFTLSGNQGNQWFNHFIDLSSYVGSNVKFRFIGTTGGGFRSDMAIDHIEILDDIIPVYCDSNGNSTVDEYIGRVQLASIDNVSGTGTTSVGYSDFTSISTDLLSGTQYTITVTPVWTGTIYNEGYAVWIDYNYDGDFDDAGELVWSQPITQNTPVSGTFTVPDDIAFEESTRMRVSMKYNGVPTSCESFDFGEVEDYTINLKYDGLLFMDSVWIPNAPSDLTGSDNALIYNGSYNIGSDVDLNNLTVNSGAALEVLETGSIILNGDLTNNGSLVLNSISNQYSSLITNGSISGNVSYKRHVNINASSGGNDLISAPVTGQTFGDFASLNANIFSNPSNPSEKLFGPFDKVTESYLTYDTNVPAEAAITLDPGVGYRAASTNNSTFTFSGTVNTGVVNVGIINSGTVYPEWNLVGNPYPSYIRLSDFLNDNVSELLATSAAVYGYDGDASDGWVIWNQAYALANPNALITPGQGFLVSSKVGGGTVSFSPSSRTIGSSDDFISGRNSQRNDLAYLRLQMSNNTDSFYTDFYFTDFATRAMDVGYDATVFNGTAPNFAIYSALVEGHEGNDIAIQSVGYDEFNQDIVFPLGINAAQGQQIVVGIESNTLPENINLYLEDTVLNTFTLLNDSDYILSVSSSLSGLGRYFLHFESQTLSNPEFDSNTLIIFTQSNPKTIVIKGHLDEVTVAKVYDIQGRLVVTSTLEGGSTLNEINADNVASGVYVIQLESDSISKSQKIIIN
ncbi:hypothetical protein C1T31_00850 [Hanstruepera neustonica]|uniref:MAM domain-containing protein n=1 Tax=Hanstruepera neustonica TaxID=1445657 RepID=A0A2K1E360_9FLAO|nr:zinc-dependent metalloprotease family protein [Hanstruepera neustonica]PNQ74722.1 hypothetical protein C1T31_00850 [Hanstruepera neustonica]